MTMPAKNTLKQYISGGFYHIYNRGVEKRDIFLDEQDYRVFLNYLKIYLSPKEEIINEFKINKYLTDEIKAKETLEIIKSNNFYEKIDVFYFVLMKNHYHLGLRQKGSRDIELFMRSLITKYSKYFNKKYDRVGHLFQGRYKGILIEKEEYFLHLSRYIHLNPREIIREKIDLVLYLWSSYPAYLGKVNYNWLKKDLLLSYFKNAGGFGFSSYQGFVEGYKEKTQEEISIYKNFLLD